MYLYTLYKAIKNRLSDANLLPGGVPVYFYIGQYQTGKGNSSLTIPAIYIEVLKNNAVLFYPKDEMSIKDMIIRIHYISYAPFKNADNAQQETAINNHETKLKAIDKLLYKWHVVDADNNKLSEQLITNATNLLNFIDNGVVSIIDYKTQIYSNHLKI